MTETPYFLVGPLRSGTTLLRLLLNAHPQICNFGEFEYAVNYASQDQFPAPEDYAKDLQRDRVFRRHGFVVKADANYVEVVRDFVCQAKQRNGKPVVGATIHGRYDLVRAIWPDAKFICLTRDPRDVARSCIHMGWVGNVWLGSDYWNEAMSSWKSTVEPTLDSCDYTVVKYEDLVCDPQGELERLCEFVGQGFAEEMLSFHKHTSYEPIDASLANQWNRKLTCRQVQLVEAKCDPLMRQFGYTPKYDAAPPKLLEKRALSVQSRFWRWRFNIGRYGLPLYLQSQLSKRFLPADSELSMRVGRKIDAVTESYLR